MTYPHTPGYKDETTSKHAAQRIAPVVSSLQERFLTLFRRGFVGTADDAGKALNINVFTARPRCTELYKLGLIERSHKVTINGVSRWAMRIACKPGTNLELPF